MEKTKTPVTVRLNPELLAKVRESAARDNRSLTNFIETALRTSVISASADLARGAARKTPKDRSTEDSDERRFNRGK